MALERKILPEVFWGSSVLDVSDMISAADREYDQDRKNKIELQFITADVIANRIAIIFGDSKKRIQPIHTWDVYPSLFEDRSDEIQEARERQEMIEFKNNMQAFADRWNGRNQDGPNSI